MILTSLWELKKSVPNFLSCINLEAGFVTSRILNYTLKKKRKKKEITHEQFYAMCQLVGKNTFLNA